MVDALRSTAPFILDPRNTPSALCAERPPFGLLDAGASGLIHRENLNRSAACQLLAERFIRRQHQATTTRLGRRCAVVGSGGVLRNSGMGASIDNHDAIIRFNGAPTLPHLRHDVGLRTTLQLSTLVPWRHWRRRVDARELAKTRDNALYCHNHWVGNCWLDALKSDGWSSKVVNPLIVAAIGSLLRKQSTRKVSRVPSSGIVGVAIAIAACDTVDVYGFGNVSNNVVCDHYWECRTDTASYLGRPTHSFRAQWAVLSQLHEAGAIRLHAATPQNAFTMPAGRPRANV